MLLSLTALDFYQNMTKYAFPLQIYLLNRRFRQHQQIIWQGKGGVQDRTIYEDSVFAKVHYGFFIFLFPFSFLSKPCFFMFLLLRSLRFFFPFSLFFNFLSPSMSFFLSFLYSFLLFYSSLLSDVERLWSHGRKRLPHLH